LLAIFGTGRNVTEMADSYHRLLQDIQELQEANAEMSEYIRNIDYVLKVGGIRMVKYNLTTHTLTLFNETNVAQLTLTQTRMLNLIDAEWKKDTERLLNNMDNKTATRIQFDVKTTLCRQGCPLHLQFHFIPFHNEKGEMTEYFGMCRDISELKAIEEKLAQETLRAQEVEVVKNAFLHNMSFEIRTPLTSVVGFAELFQMEHTPDDETVFINEIKSNSAQLLKLINDILFLSRLDADMITINSQPVDFASSITARCESTWVNDKKPGVNYIVKTPFKRLVLDIDMNNIGIVLEKIINNAVQHTTQGKVLVHYDYLGDHLSVSVEDTGRGISEKQIQHIFDRFVTEDVGNGAGLGLSICQELVQYMGGEIHLTSTVGRGTNVWFTIPCKLIEMERN
jgi:signal transduction histidine kinase